MAIEELINKLVLLGEQERIEAKTGTEAGKSILQTICAFANESGLGGGYLLLGIKEKPEKEKKSYEVIGVPAAEKLIEDLVSQCRSTVFNHPISIACEQSLIDGKTVISIFVPEVNLGKKPIYFKSLGLPQGAFRRMGSSDVQCTEDDIFILYEGKNPDTYDFTILEDATPDDIDVEAVNDYRKARAKVDPVARELEWSDHDLLLSLGCLRKVKNELKPTHAGILLFGTQIALRKFFPVARVDYIREPGTRWMSDTDNRFTSVDIRDPIMNTIRRILSAITDDLPKAFSLPEGSIQRKDIPILPTTVIREAVVNSLMHRNYRVHQPIQIIRYANRIEIRNAGYSLISEENLGEPGSKTRNPKIAQVLYDTDFAEMKGSGIRIMREKMEEAGLSPPIFESDRSNDLFVATFLFHHFLEESDLQWLKNFKQYKLSDEQAKALIFVREVGAIDNSVYRSLNHVDTLTASASLRQLKEMELLVAKNQSSATYYVPGPNFMENISQESKGHMTFSKGHMTFDQGKGQILELINKMPADLRESVKNLGKKASSEEMERVILTLCSWRALSAEELTQILNREKSKLTRVYLTPMVEKNLLSYKFPGMPKHPNQAYIANKNL